MSESMQDIKRHIKSISSTEHITNAMKLVASAEFRKSKLLFDRTNQYLGHVTRSIAELFEKLEDEDAEKYLMETRQVKNVCYIVITSNKGLCGAYNTNVIKRAEEELAACDKPFKLVTIGQKGRDYFQKRGYEIFEEYLGAPGGITFPEAKALARPIIKMFDDGEIDEIVLVYTKFVNTMHQEVTTKVLLPMDPFEIASKHEVDSKILHQIEFGPSEEAVLDYLIPEYVLLELYRAMIESSVCELIGRKVAMENATNNAQEMLDKLSLQYNRARQSAITNELIEIVAGADALK